VEYLHSVWQISIIALVAGAMIGALAYRLLAPSVKQADKIKTELDVAQKELSSYKDSVNQHFNKTSELVNDLTQNYVKVYQHLAEGAQTLGDSKTFTNLLEQHQGKVSIAVDEAANVTDKVADDLLVEPAVTQTTTGETIDEHAEPFSDSNADVTDPVSPEYDQAKAGTSSPSDNLEDSDEAREPVLNVDALEEVTADTDLETRSEVAEDEEKIEVRTTSH
jgi:uncharacterized membrane-anchored protein YhcB (DUF1043 family)